MSRLDHIKKRIDGIGSRMKELSDLVNQFKDIEPLVSRYSIEYARLLPIKSWVPGSEPNGVAVMMSTFYDPVVGRWLARVNILSSFSVSRYIFDVVDKIDSPEGLIKDVRVDGLIMDEQGILLLKPKVLIFRDSAFGEVGARPIPVANLLDLAEHYVSLLEGKVRSLEDMINLKFQYESFSWKRH